MDNVTRMITARLGHSLYRSIVSLAGYRRGLLILNSCAIWEVSQLDEDILYIDRLSRWQDIDGVTHPQFVRNMGSVATSRGYPYTPDTDPTTATNLTSASAAGLCLD